MTLFDYNQLTVDLQAAFLGQDGVRVGETELNEKVYHLYAIFGFYVEVEVVKAKPDEYTLELFPFLDGPRLDKYISDMDMTELFGRA